MGYRFRRTVRIAPGLRLNFGRRGVSLSAGIHGANLTMGQSGVHSNLGIPGTGMSYRQRLGGGRTVSTSDLPNNSERVGGDQYRVSAAPSLDEQGRLVLADSQGNPLAPPVDRAMRREGESQLRRWLEEKCVEINADTVAILHLHIDTPPPDKAVTFEATPFAEPRPCDPNPRGPGFFDRMFRGRRERIAAQNEAARQEFQAALARWDDSVRAHQEQQEKRKKFLEVDRLSDALAMQTYLQEVLVAIQWPRETTVSFEIDQASTTALMDVDLPEIEDLPAQEAAVAERGLKLNIHPISEAQLRREYAVVVHAIGFRIIGETLRALPKLTAVTLSAYSQRPDPATARVRDDYLYSVRVTRDRWSQIDFSNLKELDPVACLGSFEMRREMSSRGEFQPIDPFAKGQVPSEVIEANHS